MSRWIQIAFLHLRFINLSFWRNPSAAFFGLFFPLMFLTINSLLLGSNRIPIAGHEVTLSAFYVASMSVFAVIMSCFTNLATSILFDRDQGRLKRLRGTPTPVSAYITARVVFAICVGLLASGLCVAIGTAFFGVRPDPMNLPLVFAVIAFGAAVLAALALAVVGAVPNAHAGPAILNALTFPIVFVSGVFYPLHGAPQWLNSLAAALPVRPFANSVVSAYFGLPISQHDLLVLLAWGVAGSLIAARSFRWQPVR